MGPCTAGIFACGWLSYLCSRAACLPARSTLNVGLDCSASYYPRTEQPTSRIGGVPVAARVASAGPPPSNQLTALPQTVGLAYRSP